jgi:hypothetical protein
VSPTTPRARRRPLLRPPLEKTVEAEIITAARRMGFGVAKTSQHAKPQGMSIGIPDLYLRHQAWQLRTWVEVKRPGEKPTTAQTLWHQAERAAGGNVIVASSVAELVAGLQALGAPIT